MPAGWQGREMEEKGLRENRRIVHELIISGVIRKAYVISFLAVICGTFFLVITFDIANAAWTLSDEFATIIGHVLSSISRAFFFSGIVASLLFWVGGALNFVRVLSSKKNGVDSGSATPYKYHVLSKEYLTNAGIIARARLFVFLGLFLLSILTNVLLTSLLSFLQA